MHDFRSYIFAARIASDSGPTCNLHDQPHTWSVLSDFLVLL